MQIPPSSRIQPPLSLSQIISKFQNLKSQNILLKSFVTSLLENCFFSANNRLSEINQSSTVFHVLAQSSTRFQPFSTCNPHSQIISKFQKLNSQIY